MSYLAKGVEENIGLVHHIIGKHFPHVKNTHNYDDLFQEGAISLMECVEGYDETLGSKFSTYAYEIIRRSMRAACDFTATPIGLPRDSYRVYKDYLEYMDSGMSLEEIAEDMGRKKNVLRKIVQAYGCSSLDVKLTDCVNSSTHLDFLEYPEQDQLEWVSPETLHSLMALVPVRLRNIVTMYSEGYIQEEIADKFDLTQSNVSKRIRAFRKLYGEDFQEYLLGRIGYGYLLTNTYKENTSMAPFIECYIDYALEMCYRSEEVSRDLLPTILNIDLIGLKHQLNEGDSLGVEVEDTLLAIDRLLPEKNMEVLIYEMVGAYEEGWIDKLSLKGVI